MPSTNAIRVPAICSNPAHPIEFIAAGEPVAAAEPMDPPALSGKRHGNVAAARADFGRLASQAGQLPSRMVLRWTLSIWLAEFPIPETRGMVIRI
jgi:hypothetical protein